MSVEQIARAWLTPAPGLAAKLVLVALADHADPDGRRAWPSVVTLARMTGIPGRSVTRALRALEAAALIVCVERSSGRLPNVYELKLAELVPGVTQRRPVRASGMTQRQGTPDTVTARGDIRTERGDATSANPSGTVIEPQNAGARTREERAHRGTLNGNGTAHVEARPGPSTASPEEVATLRAALANRHALPSASDPALIELRRQQAARIAASLASTPSSGNVPILAAESSQSGKSDGESKA